MWTRPRSWAYCSASARQAPTQQTAWTYDACARYFRNGPFVGYSVAIARAASNGRAPRGCGGPRVGHRHRAQRIEDPVERRAAEVGHAQHPDVPVGEDLLEVERDDVHVLQAGQAEVLVMARRRDLQDQRPVGQRALARQERPAVRPAAELGQELEVAELVAGLREVGLPGSCAATGCSRGAAPAWSATAGTGGGARRRASRILPLLQAEAGLLVDQLDRVLIAEIGELGEELLGPGPLAALPGGGHLLDLVHDPCARRLAVGSPLAVPRPRRLGRSALGKRAIRRRCRHGSFLSRPVPGPAGAA